MGHVTRLLTIARWLRRYGTLLDERPPEVIFLTSSDASDMLADAGFAAFKIPSKTVAQKTELDKPEYKRLAKHFVWNTLGVFAPDLLVVDTFPSGSFDELFQLMDGPFKKSFICRKVKPEFAQRPTFRSALRLYDAIVAPHAESRRFDLPLPQETLARIAFSGEVVQYDQRDFLERAQGRQELGVASGGRLVYVSAGGGGDPGAEESLRQIVAAVRDMPDVHLLVGAGPLYRGERMFGPNVTWFNGTRVGRYFAAVDAAVSAGGYNTFHELLLARVPTLFFTQPKIADDQNERVQQAQSAGACLSLELTSDTPAATVAESLGSLMEPDVAARMKKAAESFLPENGAARCAIKLLEPLYDEARLQWAQQVLTPNLAYQIEATASESKSLATWLGTLLPQDQVRSLAGDARLEKLVSQLSATARSEIQSVLENDEHREELVTFETELTQLLELVRKLQTENENPTLESDVQRAVVAVMKKQSIDNELTKQWLPWVCAILSGVRKRLECGATGIGSSSQLMILRMFPKLVDVDVSGSFELFDTFMNSQLEQNRSSEQIHQTIQLIKLGNSRLTREFLLNKINQPIAT